MIVNLGSIDCSDSFKNFYYCKCKKACNLIKFIVFLDTTKIIDSICCALKLVNRRTVNCFKYYKHCTLLNNYANLDFFKLTLTNKSSANISPKIQNLNLNEYCNRQDLSFRFTYSIVDGADSRFTVKKILLSINGLKIKRFL